MSQELSPEEDIRNMIKNFTSILESCNSEILRMNEDYICRKFIGYISEDVFTKEKTVELAKEIRKKINNAEYTRWYS